MKNPWIIIGVIAAVLIGGSVWYSQGVSERNNEGVEVVEHVKGNPDAEVVLVKYSDFQCPACAQFYPVVKEVVEEFGADLRFEYRHFPLVQIHPFAEPAARAAEAAGQQGKFFEFHDKLFDNQSAWSNSVNPAQFFNQYAQELELDMAEFRAHQRSTILSDKVRSEMNSARDQGFTGTPTFTLNGERMVISTFEDFRNQIAAAIDPNVSFGLDGQRIQVETENEPTIQFGI